MRIDKPKEYWLNLVEKEGEDATISAGRLCQHSEFKAQCNVIRLTDREGGPVTGFNAEVTIACVDCGTPFEFIGLPHTVNSKVAGCSIGGLEARLPIRPSAAMALTSPFYRNATP